MLGALIGGLTLVGAVKLRKGAEEVAAAIRKGALEAAGTAR